jgi:hypothetical protein
MPKPLSDPFDPYEFGDMFAVALAALCDQGTDIDLIYDADNCECVLTVGGVDYRVRIAVDGISSDPN